MIRFQNVSFGYGLKRNVIEGLNMEIRDGERICITGKSGCGKTTILRLLMGLETPRSGIITRTEGLVYSAVFQNDRLIPHESVLRNVSLFAEEVRAKELLYELGLGEHLRSLPNELSGGMKRRVALARALCHDCDVFVMDEAFSGLDTDTKRRCLTVTDRVIGRRTLVMVTHDLPEADNLHAEIIKQ